MPLSTIYLPSDEGRFHQGEILANVKQYVVAEQSDGEITSWKAIKFDICVVVSQECDLEQDFKIRKAEPVETPKLLKNVLLCVALPAELFKGTPQPGDDPVKIDSKGRQSALRNKNERFHFLESHDDFEELFVDFKSYLTIPTSDLYSQVGDSASRLCRLSSPYMEQLSNRCFSYLSRIALPREHLKKSDKDKALSQNNG